ncbi:SPOR domain-containing protein [Bauldia sp.]|uniref:SPOR domain-containing protein n=1 Tax=Bauldia sp. TaxID=2575872 RepID=UPI003BAA2E95
MPDRYDPKVPVRPPGERKPAASTDGDDPLAELARMVTGRAGFDQPPEEPTDVPAPETTADGDLTADLESELLNDLQASFAALGEPLADPAPADQEHATPEAEIEPPAASHPADTIPPEDFQTTSEFVPPAPDADVSEPLSPTPEDPLLTVEDVLAELQAPDLTPAPPPAAAAPPVPPEPPTAEPPVAASAAPEPVAPEPQLPQEATTPPPTALRSPASDVGAPTPSQPPEPPRSARRAPEQLSRRSDFSRLQLRPSRPDASPEAPSDPTEAAPATETERPARRIGDRGSRLAPRPAGRVRAEPSRQLANRGEARDVARPMPDMPPPGDADFLEDFSLDDLDTASFTPEDELPPFPEEELANLKRRRSGRAVAIIAVILVVAAAGAAGAYLMSGGTSSDAPPPVITADTSPAKVFPEETGATDEEQQGKLIYDRVDEGDSGAETTLVTRDDPIAEVPSEDPALADNPIARVIVPGGPGVDGPITDAGDGSGGANEAPAVVADDVHTPRKVRTVVVRPDGTIVSSEAVEEGAADATEATPAPPIEESLDTVVADARTEMDAVLEGQDVAVDPDPLGVTDPDRALALAPSEVGSAAAETEAVVAETTVVTETPANTLPAPAPEPAPLPTPQPEASAPAPAPEPPANTNGGPIDLAAGTVPAGPAAGTGGVLVQVSAQRTEEAARSTYRELQARYPGILGPYQAAIIRADLGDRGIYYRVRIGPFSDSDAARLCDDLKAAGGDCLLAR